MYAEAAYAEWDGDAAWGWTTGRERCLACGHTWIGVHPAAPPPDVQAADGIKTIVALECPCCHQVAAIDTEESQWRQQHLYNIQHHP